MADIFFYHLTSTSLDQALPKLLEKALQGNFKANVRVSDAGEAERLNSWLWNYNPDSFLPHGTAQDGSSDQQPIYITPQEENPNAANLLVVTCGLRPTSANTYTRVLYVFDGSDETQVAGARSRWKEYTAEGHTLSYIRQNAAGGWEKQNL